MSFMAALSNVLIALFYVVPGFVIRKMNKAKPEHLSTTSAILIYIGTPFLEVSAFLSLDYSIELIKQMGLFFVVSFTVQAAFIGIMSLILHKQFDKAKYRIMSAASVMGNVGFFGLPIVRALMPDHPEAAAFSTVTMLSMNMLVFTVGVFCFTGDKKYMSLKSAVFNPTMFGFVLGMFCFLTGMKNVFPSMLISGIQSVGNMTMPLCMFILGIRLASSPLKSIFSDPNVWIIAALKLIAFPLFCYAAVVFLPLTEVFKATLVILMSTPCAAVILSLAELHKSEPELSANCITVSTLLCFMTIPLLTLLFA